MAQRRKTTKAKTASSFLTRRNLLLAAILLLAVSYIFLLSTQTGVLGEWIRSFYFLLFGISAYLVPLYLIVLFFLILTRHFKGKQRTVLLWAGGLILLLLSLLSVYYTSDTLSFGVHVDYSRQLAAKGAGSGVIAASFGWILRRLLGTVGSTALVLVYLAAGLMYLFSLTFKDIAAVLGHWGRTLAAKGKDRMEKRREPQKQAAEPAPPEKTPIAKEPLHDNALSYIDYQDEQSETAVSDDQPAQLAMREFHPENRHVSTYEKPPLDLLAPGVVSSGSEKKEIVRKAEKIENTLANFGIDAKVTQVNRGPTVTCFEMEPAPGVKVSRIVSLSDDLALNLAASDIRIVAPLPGKAAVGLEVPNETKDMVTVREIIEAREFQQTSAGLPFALGKTITGKPIVSAIEKMPHMLIAGATGSGKSVCINTIIMSLLYHARPDEVKLVLIDPKMVELSVYNGIPHLIVPVVTQPKKAAAAMFWAVEEMERRYKLFSENRVRDITTYRQKAQTDDTLDPLPYIVIIIDELADLMMVAANEVESYIARLAQMARACGIHLIVATQRPSVDVITGTIKANIPSRISFQVSSQVDSRTILDMAGAEKLLGKGDMLFYPTGFSKPLRVQGAFITENEVEKVVSWLKESHKQQYDAEVLETIEENTQVMPEPTDGDPMLSEALDIILNEGQASVSLLQRKMKVGYARAGRMIDELEEGGYIGRHEGSKPRKLLVSYNPMKEADHESGE